MAINNLSKIYLGVYGIFIDSGKVLVIKKARGPYLDKYDLPGGGIEFNEKILDCLSREIKEETGSNLLSSDFLKISEYMCRYKKNDEIKDFHHIAIYYKIKLEIDNLKKGPDGEDSLGAELISLDKLNETNVAPIAWPIIEKFK